MDDTDDFSADQAPPFPPPGGVVMNTMLREHPEIFAAWILLAVIDVEQQAVSVLRFAGKRRGIQLAPTVVGLIGGAAAITASRLLRRVSSTGSLPYRVSLALLVFTVVGAPIAGLSRRGVVLRGRSPLWGCTIPIATQLGWILTFVNLGRRERNSATNS